MQTKTAYVFVCVWAFLLTLFLSVNISAQSLASSSDSPGQGTLIREGEVREVVPLKHTNVKMSIVGFVASVDVEQIFINPYSEKIEATYIFPLPSTSAVDNLEMLIGDRVVKGNIATREEAQEEFNQASSQGKKAALLEQERPNVFAVTIANIEPTNEITVRIHYTQRLFYEEGTFRVSFPMVVMPRYVPGVNLSSTRNENTNSYRYRTRNTSRLNPPRISDETRAGNISLTIDLMAGIPIKEITSISHQVNSSNEGVNRYEVRLAEGTTIPNKDFILEYKLDGNDPKGALFQAVSEDGEGYFLLMAVPPTNFPSDQAYPKDVLLVIDISGSMSGQPLQQAKEGLIKCLEMLNPQDTFNIIPFESSFKPFFEENLSVTKENIAKATEIVKGLQATGGTEILAPLVHVLKEHEKIAESRISKGKKLKKLPVVVVFSDGGIGNEEEVLYQAKQHLGKARIFTFGMGPHVNEYFMKKLAQIGRGTVEFVPADEANILPYIARFQKRISNPILIDISLKWPGNEILDLSPSPIPDLYLNQPLFLTGRFNGTLSGTPILKAKTSKSKKNSIALEIDTSVSEIKVEVLSALWARARLEDFTDMLIEDPDNQETQQKVLDLALKHKLLSPVTAFVAVDSSSSTLAGPARKVTVPVLAPQGWQAGSMLLSANLSSANKTLRAPRKFTAKPSLGKSSGNLKDKVSKEDKKTADKKHKKTKPDGKFDNLASDKGKKPSSLLPKFPSKSKDPIPVLDYGFDIRDPKALIAHLVKNQASTGQWPRETSALTLRSTSLAILAILEESKEAKEEELYNFELLLASDYLVSNIDGFGRLFEVAGHAQETEIQAQVFQALKQLFLVKPKLVEGKQEFLDLLKQRLVSLRSESGLWYGQENGQESLSATVWALIALGLEKEETIKLARTLDRKASTLNNAISIESLLMKFWTRNKLSPEQTKLLEERLSLFDWAAPITNETLFTLMLLDKIDSTSAKTMKEGVMKYSLTPANHIDMLALRYLIFKFDGNNFAVVR